MVGKKQNSKSIFYILFGIVLMLCLFFSVSGAWFTASASSSASGSSFSFRLGYFGDVEISVGDYTWQDIDGNNIYATQQAKTAANDNSGIVRDVLMPGDKLESGTVTLTFDEDLESTDTNVYYLIKVGNTYYTINNSHQLVASTTTAGMISAGANNALTINGSVISVTTLTSTYYLDGSNSTATSSFKIDDWAQGKTLVEAGAQMGGFTMTASGVLYQVAVIQSANLSATSARALLIDEIAAMS